MSPQKQLFDKKDSDASKGGSGGSVAPSAANRRIRVFISSTFRDMIAERDDLMTHTWPALRRFCQERHVELVEVDLRWGIAESQSTRKETLKFCLDEIRACRLVQDVRGTWCSISGVNSDLIAQKNSIL